MVMKVGETIYAVEYPMGHLSVDILRFIQMPVNGIGMD